MNSAYEYGLGLLDSPPDERDYLLQLAAPTEPLPLVYSAYEKTGALPVLNQGKTPYCAAYASSILKTYQEKIDEKRMLIFDAPWLYKQAKLIDGYPDKEGTSIRAVMSVLKNKGVPRIGRFGYGAELHKIAAYFRVPIDVHSFKLAIQQYGPIVVGSMWFESWMHPVKGILPRPDKTAGGHGTEWFGWDDRVVTPVGVGVFYGQNSWSAQWGIGGAFLIPYRYLTFVSEAVKAVDVIDGEISISQDPFTSSARTKLIQSIYG